MHTQVILFLIWETENTMSATISGQVCLNIKNKSCYVNYVKIPYYNVKLLLLLQKSDLFYFYGVTAIHFRISSPL